MSRHFLDMKRWYQVTSLPGRPYISFSREEVEKLTLCRDLLKYLLPEGMESIITGGLGKVAMLMDMRRNGERRQP